MSSPKFISPHKLGISRSSKTKTVDLVTGNVKVEYYFDPSLIQTPSTGLDLSKDSITYDSSNLFLPCTIVKTLEAENNVNGSNKKNGSKTAIPALVKTSDGTLHKICDINRLTRLTSPEDYIGIDNVLHLPNVMEASLLHTLRLRFKRDTIYTNAGPVLISVNPYKTINDGRIYGEDKMMQYRKEGQINSMDNKMESELPPHLFEVADRAYSTLVESSNDEYLDENDAGEDSFFGNRKDIHNQSIIISGESGAGKTEATKVIMQYLARITRENGTDDEYPDQNSTSSLSDRVLSSNPLLESFGNARTLRNDNSSRFGKFIQISFTTDKGLICGARIKNYLLEKTRVTTQIDGERNYHIFHQLLSGGDDELLAELGLDKCTTSFSYLGNFLHKKSRRDVTAFAQIKECLSKIELTPADQKTLFCFVAAVLHLGNIQFEIKNDDGNHNDNAVVTPDSKSSLSKACQLLGIDEKAVEAAILTKVLIIGGKTIYSPQDVIQASDKRDAFAKMIYSSLFIWLVHRVNQTISGNNDRDGFDIDEQLSPVSHLNNQGMKNVGFIGVLDIYGFEQFDINGFEQLLINYANEKLQNHFNTHLFEVEQNIYAEEGVDWTYITFNDNRPCLELIEGGGLSNSGFGVLTTLDDSWGGMGTVSEKDVKFVTQLHQLFGGLQETQTTTMKKKKVGTMEESEKNACFITPKFGNDRQFIIVHYAGEVRYTANGFIEKNVETLSNQLKELGNQSRFSLALEIFSRCTNDAEDSTTADPLNKVTNRRRGTNIRGVSVASQFCSSLQSLVSDIEKTQPHFIRCIKSNLTKSSNMFDGGEVLRQLKYAGMMETIRIRREGYAVRETHQNFYNRFYILLHSKDLKRGEDVSHLIKVLSKRLKITDSDWQMGHSKIFLRRDLAAKLDRMALLRVHCAARTVSKFGRFVAERRASKVITCWARFRIHLLRKYHEQAAVTKIASIWKMRKAVLEYKTSQQAVLKLQTLCRKRLAIKFVRKLRDPYEEMSFKDLELLYQEKNECLEVAVQSKNFQIAAAMEKLLGPLKEAMEGKRPMTRNILDKQINEIQEKLDDAVARKAYTECAPLQVELKALILKKDDYPTIEELKKNLAEAEANVISAAERRDFSVAVKRQKAVDDAKKRLNETLAAEGLDDELDSTNMELQFSNEDNKHIVFTCRRELEIEIENVKGQIENAILQKEFQNASSTQEKLNELESLRCNYPTIDEMNSELSLKYDEMASVVKQKKFGQAATLQDEIDVLEERIILEEEKESKVMEDSSLNNGVQTSTPYTTTLNGSKIEFHSRIELDLEITKSAKKVQESVESKQFKDASDLQEFIHRLENLKSSLPTLHEQTIELEEVKLQMKEALKTKNFVMAGTLNETVEKLESNIEKEKKRKKN